MPGGPGADFRAWGSRLAPLFLLVLLTVLQGASLNTSLWAPLLCLGVMEFLRHLVGWVFRIWCGFTLPPRDGALPAGVRGSGRGPSNSCSSQGGDISGCLHMVPMRQALLSQHLMCFYLLNPHTPALRSSAIRPSSQG